MIPGQDWHRWFSVRLKLAGVILLVLAMQELDGAGQTPWPMRFDRPIGVLWGLFFPEHFAWLGALRTSIRRRALGLLLGLILLGLASIIQLGMDDQGPLSHAIAFALITLASAIIITMFMPADNDRSQRAKRSLSTKIAELMAKILGIHRPAKPAREHVREHATSAPGQSNQTRHQLMNLAAFSALFFLTTKDAVPATNPSALASASRAFAKVTDYRMTLTVHETSSDRTEDRVYTVLFQKPSLERVDITSGNDKGRQIVWQGGAKVKTHRGGMLGQLHATQDLHDSAVSSLRGDAIDTLTIPAMINDFTSINGKVSQTPGPEIDGVHSTAITLDVEDPSVDEGVTRVVLYLSNVTHLPIRREHFSATQLVKTEDVTDLQLNPGLTASDFPW